MMDPIIREIKLSDASQLTSLLEQLGYPATIEDVKNRINAYLNHPLNQVWVTEVNRHVIGVIAVNIEDNFHRINQFARIMSLVVDKNYRQEGVGRLLLQYAEEYAKKMGCDHVELTSGMHRAPMGSHDFYLKNGYEDLNTKKKYFAKWLN